MKKILLLDTSYPINNRNIKILSSLPEFEKYVITWNRDRRPVIKNENWKEYFYAARADYGNYTKKLLKIFSYASFVKQHFSIIKPDYIIASHWPMLVIAALLKPKNAKLVYENLDMPTARYSFILYILRVIEKAALKRAEYIFLASRFYKNKYLFYKAPIIILENRPFRNILSDKAVEFYHVSDRLKVSFIGNLRYFDCMCNLINAADKLPIDVLFFGEGPDYQSLLHFSEKYTNTYFFGKYDYEDIKCIYELSDIIWAVYPNEDYNVKYAISNKFFESLIFERPAFYAENTELGNFAAENDIGFTVDPYNIEKIRGCFVNLIQEKDKLLNKVDAIRRYNSSNPLFWDDYIQTLQEVFSK